MNKLTDNLNKVALFAYIIGVFFMWAYFIAWDVSNDVGAEDFGISRGLFWALVWPLILAVEAMLWLLF